MIFQIKCYVPIQSSLNRGDIASTNAVYLLNSEAAFKNGNANMVMKNMKM